MPVGPFDDALKILVDVAEPRLLYDRLIVPVEGDSWDASLCDHTYIDPLTKTLMLSPLPTLPDWETNFAGAYVRFSKADYTLPTPDAWAESSLRGVGGDVWLTNLGITERVTTAGTYPANQPWSVSLKLAKVASASKLVCFECGWHVAGGSPSSLNSVSLRFLASGDVEVWEGDGSTQKRSASYDQQGAYYTTKEGNKAPASFSLLGRVVNLMLIPCRRRDLLVIADGIGGCVHTFADIVSGQDIVPGGKFWWRVGAGSGAVQVAPLRFAAAGNAYGPVATLRYAPQTGRVFQSLPSYDEIGTGSSFDFGLVLPDNSDAFIPNGARKQCRLKIALNGGSSANTATPTVFSAEMIAPPVLTSTYDAPFDLTPYVTVFDLSVSEAGTATCHVRAKNPDKITTAGLPYVLITSDRPVAVSVGGVEIFRGTLSKPRPVYELGHTKPLYVEWDGTDRDGVLNLHQFVETFPYDGLNLTDQALPDVYLSAGIPSETLNITPDTYELPFTPGVSRGEWTLLPREGDTAGRWRDKLTEDYIATWSKGWGPGRVSPFPYLWNCERPDTLPTAWSLPLYICGDDARAGNVPGAWVSRRVYRMLRPMTKEAEANQVIVKGQDPHSGAYVVAQRDDAASQNPELAPSARPGNWRGQTARVQYADPLINNQDAADYAADVLASRVLHTKTRQEVDCDLLALSTDGRVLWKGDLIRLYNFGFYLGADGERGTGFDDWRIVAIPRMAFVFEGDGTRFRHRECTYLLEKWIP